MKLINLSLVVLLASCTIPAYSMWADHNAFRYNGGEHLAQAVPKFLKSGGVIGAIIAVGAFHRLLNKPYNQSHFSMAQSFNPITILEHPLQCIDDGIIGHAGGSGMGFSYNPSYGILGSTMAVIPHIARTIGEIDHAKRMAESCLRWINDNIRQVQDSRPQFVSVVHHFENKLLNYYRAIVGNPAPAPQARGAAQQL